MAEENREQIPKVKAKFGFRDRIVVDICPYCGCTHYHSRAGRGVDVETREADCFKGQYQLDFTEATP